MAWSIRPALEAWLHPDAATAPLGGRLPDPVSAALPLFLLLVAIEAAVSSRRTRLGRGAPLYNLRQTSSNLAAGTLAVLLGGWWVGEATLRAAGVYFECVLLEREKH